MFLNQFEAKKFNVNEIVDLRLFIDNARLNNSSVHYSFSVVTRKNFSSSHVYEFYRDKYIELNCFEVPSSNLWFISPISLRDRLFIKTNGERIYTYSLSSKNKLVTDCYGSYEFVRIPFSQFHIVWENTQIMLVRGYDDEIVVTPD